MPGSSELFSKREKAQIATAIAEVQARTSGLIKVYIDSTAGVDTLAKAHEVFEELDVDGGGKQDGVLLYIAEADGRLVILGGTDLNKKVPGGFWNRVRDGVQEQFRDGKFLDGVLHFVREAGRQLQEHFPAYRKAPAMPGRGLDGQVAALPKKRSWLPEKRSGKPSYRPVEHAPRREGAFVNQYGEAVSRFAPRRKRPAREKMDSRMRHANRVLGLGLFGLVLPLVGSLLAIFEFFNYRSRYAHTLEGPYRPPPEKFSYIQPRDPSVPDGKAAGGLIAAIAAILIWVGFAFYMATGPHHPEPYKFEMSPREREALHRRHDIDFERAMDELRKKYDLPGEWERGRRNPYPGYPGVPDPNQGRGRNPYPGFPNPNRPKGYNPYGGGVPNPNREYDDGIRMHNRNKPYPRYGPGGW